jgi:hypothetical protein
MQNKVAWSNTTICASHLTGPPASSSYDVYCFGKVLLELITGNFGVSGSNDADSDEWLARTLGYIDAYDKEGVSGTWRKYGQWLLSRRHA